MQTNTNLFLKRLQNGKSYKQLVYKIGNENFWSSVKC